MQDNPQTQQYLERVVAIYENNFTTKAGAKKYLESRNITDAGLFTKHAVGFCDGTLNEILPKNGGIRDTLKQIGILLDNGSERFKNCVVFPVYDVDGHLITLYGRHIDDASGKKHVFLPNRPTGLWNSNIIKTCSEIILTESVIDALSVQMAGFNNVVSIQSTNGLSDQDIRELKTYGVNKIILLLDGDPPGTKASERLKKKLSDFMVDIRSLPDNHDPNSFLIKHGPQKLAELIQSSSPVPGQNPAPEQAKEEQQSLSGPVPPQPPPSDGFVIACGMRQYQIMSLDKGAHKLKVTIRLEHRGKLHVDTLDFYSSRARKNFAADICRIFEELPDNIDADFTRIIRECENIQGDPLKAKEPKQAAPLVAGKEKDQAEKFGKSKNLINTILNDFKTCGLIGEEANKLLGYIAMTSRKRNEPLCMLILSSSGWALKIHTVQDLLMVMTGCRAEEISPNTLI
jgi:DNA primase